ncbi:tetratricopeptide repeat protein 28-like [Branchiostoma floridae]|uniref:Tetratricopeptide repeat protein 28-like n=1 Tax=Branchiostoma floridae TaxID=7739 RepID=A0A9J7N0C5_BRAFL|nr:tetratricopeptide repeat protein 28-like [Branchiostoma floridae]
MVGSPDDATAQHPASDLASLDVSELERLMEDPDRKNLHEGRKSATDDHRVKLKIETLDAELNTSAGNKAKQFDLCSQIGDLYRTELHDLESALQYYQNMLECSKSLEGDAKEAKANNRLGLTYDILGVKEEAIRCHERALEIYKTKANKELEMCAAYKNLASSLALFDQVPGAKTNYESALAVATETGNKAEQVDIYCRVGDLHRNKLDEPQVSHKYYTKMLALARELGWTHVEGEAYGRLGYACSDMEDSVGALEWHLKNLKVQQDEGDKKEEVTAHMDVGNAYIFLDRTHLAMPHFNTALQMAQQTGNLHKQLDACICLGEMHRNQLDSPRTAIQYYEQYLALARQLGDRRAEGTAYNRLGLVHHSLWDLAAALGWYQKSLQMREEDGDISAQMSQHMNVGHAYTSMDKPEQAKFHFDKALQLAQQIEDQPGQMQVYLCLGDIQSEQLHSPRTAIQYYEQHLTLANQLEDRVEEGLAYNRLGQVHYEMGEYEAALEWYQKQLTMSQENGDETEQINAQANVGNAYMNLNKTDQATSHFNTALQLAEWTGDQYAQMRVSFYLGDLYKDKLHSPRTAIQYYKQQLTLARQLGDRNQEGVAYNRLGLSHSDMGELEAALEWNQKALKTFEEVGDTKEQIAQHTNMGDAYRRLGKLDQATSHFSTALQMAQQTGDLHGQMGLYLRLGEIQREQLHSPRTAIQYFEQYHRLARHLGDKNEEIVAYNKLGQAHYEFEEYGTALDWFHKHLALATQLGDVHHQGVAYCGLGAACHGMGELQAALEWFQKYFEMSQESGEKKEELKAHLNLASCNQALNKPDLARFHYQSAMTIAMETGDKQQLAEINLKLGDLHRLQLQEPQVSLKYYTEMLELARDLERKDAERQAYNKLGLACNGMQDHEAAVEWHQKNLAMSEENEDKITAHENIAQSYQAMGKPDLARPHVQAAVTLTMATGNRPAVSTPSNMCNLV